MILWIDRILLILREYFLQEFFCFVSITKHINFEMTNFYYDLSKLTTVW